MTQEKSYKDTLNLPQTSFAMKADLAKREPDMLRGWEEEGLYARLRQKSKGRPQYILHDGPPYANGHTHIGHALNKILKDIIVKYKTLRGFDALYVPGWDCHGLPIEHACLKEMGKRKEEVERVAFRKQARQYAERFVKIQREEFKRLGIFGEWDKPYLTMNYDYQASIAESFLSIYEKGYIEQRLKPVPWCWDCETALADAELEYEDKTDATVYVAFEIVLDRAEPAFLNLLSGKKASVLIWTTTPWTLPANVGIAYNPHLDYVVAKVSSAIYVFAKDLAGTLKEKFGWKEMKIVSEFKGAKIPFAFAKHPFIERNSKVMDADYVSSTDGTGFVHIAPGHGEEDYQCGHLEHALPILSPVDERGRFLTVPGTAGTGSENLSLSVPGTIQGLHVFKSNEKIIELLKQKGVLLHTEPYTHSYPHCWRCRKPIIFRATPQWFLKVDHENLRQKMTETIGHKIQFTPDWGKNRIGSMVETRPDWCLSRQRYWGVPIPVISCKSCHSPVGAPLVSAHDRAGARPAPTDKFRGKIVEIFQKEGADSWFTRPSEDFLPPNFKCPLCGGSEFTKETDIIDVWFDSGVSHQAVLKPSLSLRANAVSEAISGSEIASSATPPRNDYGLTYPADLYLEGSDQHRGWFQSSLTTAMALEGTPPFKGILTHGFVVDGEGKKMSKSAGNVVAPQDVMKEFGADILRLWVSSCDYSVDVRLSKEILKQLADAYRKIRNTFRYILANLYDFDPERDSVKIEQLNPLDRWAIVLADNVAQRIEADYDRFAFHEIYQQAYHFCTVQLSSYYFDVLKDTLYTGRKAGPLRRSAQQALFYILRHMSRWLAPILPMTMDEVWRSFAPLQKQAVSVLETEWKRENHEWKGHQDWSHLRAIRNAVTPFLEKKREEGMIGSSLDAKIYLQTSQPELTRILKDNWKELPRVFIVSQVEWMQAPAPGAEETLYQEDGLEGKIGVAVAKADGAKCVRCWNFSTAVGSNAAHPGLCAKCLDAIV